VDILHLIDRLEELVAEAKRMPIGQGVIIERRRLLELVDQMRSTLPWEIKEADEIVKTRDNVLEEARREAEGIIHRAELEAQQMLDEMELTKQAEAQAAEIIRRAEERAQEMLDDAQIQVQAKLSQAERAANNQMDEADKYALEMLKRLQAQLDAFSSTVRAGIESLEGREQEAEDIESARA
jgi:vacuolar-type H+-ATPase subunit H